jgi:hypothetical protein
VEKLDAISRKYQQERAGKAMPINFIRHYYDVYKLLEANSVLDFVGTDAYRQHKTARFRRTDEMNLTDNEAFILRDQRTRALYAAEYSRTKALYYDDFPSFDSILERIESQLEKL